MVEIKMRAGCPRSPARPASAMLLRFVLKTGAGMPLLPDGSVADDRLVSGARLAALAEDRFLRFKTEAFISDGDEILHAFGDSGRGA